MKTIGMIGGTGWPSTLEYYRIINQETNRRLGGLNSAKIILSSFNYGEIDLLNKKEDHAGVYKLVLDAAQRLKKASVDFLIICANTMHQYVDALEQETGLKIVHIADATAKEIKKIILQQLACLVPGLQWKWIFTQNDLINLELRSLVPAKTRSGLYSQLPL